MVSKALPAGTLLPVRLYPGEDLRRAVESALAAVSVQAAFVVCGIGSLGVAQVRFAGAATATPIAEDLEILSLSGSVAPGASHLHVSLAGADGRVFGGHAAYGCTVRTTAELLLALLPGWRFAREPDAQTGYAELIMRRIDDTH